MAARKLTTEEHDQTVHRLLRNRASREYFKGGAWTSNPEEADSFEDIVAAAEACTRYGLSNIELALRHRKAGADLFCTLIR